MSGNDNSPIVDIDCHHGWKTSDEVLAYLPERWRDHAAGAFPQGPAWKANHLNTPGGGRLADSRPDDGSPPATSLELTREQLLDRYGIWRAVLTFNIGGHAIMPNPDYSIALARAAHDWNADTWLTWDDRLYGVAAPPIGQPEEAAKEIRRIGSHPRIVATLLTGCPLGVPYGHPVYHPIYEASAEMGLAIDMHAGGTPFDRQAGGLSETHTGAVTGNANDAMHHITSFIVHGVFERFPSLRLLVKEHGTTFLPLLAWRLDKNYEVLKQESPWVKKWPSEYLREHVKVGTQPLEVDPDDDVTHALYDAIEGASEMFCYASDYPHISFDTPDYVVRHLPSGWADNVLLNNACAHYGWSPQSAGALPAGSAEVVSVS